jgi:hypothetical protein
MPTSQWFLNPASWISIAALIISIVSWLTSWRTQRRQVRIAESAEQERAEAKKRALLSARIVNGSQRNSHKLAVENSGQGTARDIRILMDGRPLIEHHSAVVQASELPQVIGPGSEVTFLLSITLSLPPPAHILIDWNDDTGEPSRFESSLSLP